MALLGGTSDRLVRRERPAKALLPASGRRLASAPGAAGGCRGACLERRSLARTACYAWHIWGADGDIPELRAAEHEMDVVPRKCANHTVQSKDAVGEDALEDTHFAIASAATLFRTGNAPGNQVVFPGKGCLQFVDTALHP